MTSLLFVFVEIEFVTFTESKTDLLYVVLRHATNSSENGSDIAKS